MNTSKVPNDISELSRLKAVNFYRKSQKSEPNELEPGQIWSTHASFRLPNNDQFQTDEPKLVVILLGSGAPSKRYESITVAPISNLTSMASEFDFIIRKDEESLSSVPFDMMIEVWNETPALKGQLRNFIGSLPDETIIFLHQLYSARLLGSEVPENLKNRIGLSIVAEDDPRLSFQEEEINAASYLANAATASLELDIVEEESPVEILNWLKLDIVPILGKLSNLLSNPAFPIVASAANNIDSEMEQCLIVQLEKKEKLIFELLNSRMRPYLIYLKAYSIAPEFIGRKCFVSVITKEQKYTSPIIDLREDITIEVGKDAHFRCENVESVEFAIESR